jgi:hypothetical protein
MPLLKVWDPKAKLWIPAGGPAVSLTDAPGCHVHATAAEAVVQNTNVTLDFAVADFDTHGFWNSNAPTKLTVPAGQAGTYTVTASAHVPTAASTGTYDLYIRKNGTTSMSVQRIDASDSASGYMFLVSWTGVLAVADYVEIVGYQTGVATIDYGYVSIPFWLQASIMREAAGTPGPTGHTGAVSATSGVQFPATQVPSADANNLDDYEEGTFTPGVAFGGGTTGITYTIQVGLYTKKGREVSCSITVRLSDNGSSTGAMTITGLPFATFGDANYYHSATIGYYADLTVGYGTLSGIIDPGASVIRMFTGNTGTNVLTMTDVATTNTTFLILSVTYSV